MLLASQRAIDIRDRLRNPPNAVVDRPIELRNGRPVPSLVVEVIPEPLTASVNEVITEATKPSFDDLCLEFFNQCIAVSAEQTDDTPFSRQVTIKQIIKAVARYYKISITEMLSERRSAYIVRPRQVAMWLSKELTTYSFPYIGFRMNGRDHTTVLHGVRKIESLRKIDLALQAELDELQSALRPTRNESDDNAEATADPSP